MRKGFLTFIFALLASVDAFAAAPTPAYKLGNTYTSETGSGKKCLEGHSGAMLGNADCTDLAQGCKNNSECSSKFGTGYVCAKGGASNSGNRRGVCMYQECSGTGDTSCSTKYSHMRSCVKNEIGVFECRITCNWQKIIEKGYGVINSINVAKRMQYEHKLWSSSLSSFSLDPDYFKSTIEYSWYTCKNGKVTRCTRQNFGTALSNAEWDSGNNVGVRYQPCLPCSIASGGTWGIGTDENIDHVGSRAYSAGVTSSTDIGHDLAVKYTSYRYKNDSSGTYDTFYIYVNSDRCASETALKTNNLMTKLNNSTTFSTWVASNITKLSSAGLTGVVELGMSDVCSFWHSRGSYQSGNRTLFSCKKNNTKYCLKSDELQILTYVPKQNVTKTLPSASSPTGGSSTYSYNFNKTNGTLLCCRIGADDGNDRKNNNIKNCIVIKN